MKLIIKNSWWNYNTNYKSLCYNFTAKIQDTYNLIGQKEYNIDPIILPALMLCSLIKNPIRMSWQKKIDQK